MRSRRTFLRLTGSAAGAALATARYGIDEVAALTQQAAAGGRTPPSKRDALAIARHLDATVARFQLLARRLQGRKYLAGDAFTIADIPAGMTLYRWYAMDIERPQTPNVDAWYGRLQERPAYRTGICIPFDELVGKESF